MIITELQVKGVFLIDLEKLADERGFFARVWCQRELETHGLRSPFVQCNIAFNKQSGTLRGLHYQALPHQEVKLIQCIRGALYDVVLDLRPNSPTYKQWVGIELTEDRLSLIYVPEGCAHGYQTQTDNTQLLYHVSQFYAPKAERGIRWDDPTFGIKWPLDGPVVSRKDSSWPNFDDVFTSLKVGVY